VPLARKPLEPHTLRLYAWCGQASFARSVPPESEIRPRPVPPSRAFRLKCTLSCTIFQSMRSANLILGTFIAGRADILRINAGFWPLGVPFEPRNP